MLNDGQTMLEMVPPSMRELISWLAAESEDNTLTLPLEIWREVFLNSGDLELARRSCEQLSPEPFQQRLEPLNLTKFHTLHTPRSYLVGTEDAVMPPGEWGWLRGCPADSGCTGSFRCPEVTNSCSPTRQAWPTSSSRPDGTRSPMA